MQINLLAHKLLIYFFSAILGISPLVGTGQSYSTSNLKFLYGSGFDDWYYGNSTENQHMHTITFEHFSDFGLGDLFFFIDFYSGDFANQAANLTGQNNTIYAELTTRISLSKTWGRDSLNAGWLSDIMLAGQINRGENGFEAHLIGLGFKFDLPGFSFADINLYYRSDDFSPHTYQISAVWDIPFRINKAKFSFGSFIDMAGTDQDGLDVYTRPKMLWHFGSFSGRVDCSIGTELYIHTNNKLTTIAPQILLAVTF